MNDANSAGRYVTCPGCERKVLMADPNTSSGGSLSLWTLWGVVLFAAIVLLATCCRAT